MNQCSALQAKGEVVTGLLYVDPEAPPTCTPALNTSGDAAEALDERALCPGAAALASVNAALR